jgi:hypothetical protein
MLVKGMPWSTYAAIRRAVSSSSLHLSAIISSEVVRVNSILGQFDQTAIIICVDFHIVII